MTGPLVSCIVPVHNGAPFIGAALDSIFAQDHQPIEVIVIDDASSDATAEVVQGYGDAVRYSRQARAGPAAARNRGIGMAKGDFIAFLDADDLWLPGKLSRQLQGFRDDPALEISICLLENFIERRDVNGRPHVQVLGTVPGFQTGGMLFSRACLERHGLFDPDLQHGSELDWFIRARDAAIRETRVEEVLIRRRLHGDNMSINGAANSYREHLAVLRARLRQRAARP